jgi:hypothetical protein
MSCCSERGCSAEEVVGNCPDCDEPVDKDGNAADSCSFSPVCCETCGRSPCDQSC